jgi:hypothetical protein
MFMVLVDIDARPACLTGWLGEEGYIERSLVYLRELDPVRTYYDDMLRVEEHVRRNHCNESFHELLASHRDPPLAESSRVAHPAWSSLAPPGHATEGRR